MNKKEKERTGFIVRNIKTEKRDAQNGGADKMGNVKMISPAVPNMPWQERSEKIVNAPVWRYKENPIIGRNPVEGVARIFNSAVIPYEGKFIGVFRGEQTNGIPYVYLGRSEDGIHWDFDKDKVRFVDEEGNIMGRHKGLIHYTIGQRKGLGIPSATPIFVKELRPENNEVVLCKSESLFRRECAVANVNYMAEESLAEPVHAIGKVRYSHAGAPCMIYPQADGTLRIVFDEPQRAMTPGQAAVFYRDDYVLCGGTIEREAR